MPDDPRPEGAAEGAESTPSPTPSYVTSEQLNSFADTVLNRIADIAGAAAARSTPPPPSEPSPTFDLDSLNQKIREGDPNAGTELLRAAEIIADRKVAKVRREEVEPLRAFGLNNMEAMAKEMALKDKVHAKRYQKEIDAFLASAPAEVRSNVQGWNEAYNLVVGRHNDELQKEAVEAAIRQEGATRAAAPPPSSASGYFDEGKTQKIPTPEELLGPDVRELMAIKKVATGDELVKKMGYKDWPSYAKMARDYDVESQYADDNPHQMYPNSAKGIRHGR